MNSRLDEMQAADSARAPDVPAGMDRQRRASSPRRYRTALADAPIVVPLELDPGHVYHLFVIRTAERDRLQAHLNASGISTLIHYPIPVPRQPAFAQLAASDCPIADRVCAEVLSLPFYPALPDSSIAAVASALHAWQGAPAKAVPR